MVKHLLLDTDPGGDDALAIAYALWSADAQVVGVAATAGNDVLAVTTKHAAQVLDYFGATEVALARGSGRRDAFIRKEKEETALRAVAAELGWPSPARLPQRPTDDLFREVIREHPEDLTLVALAPLTNIADVLRQHGEDFHRIREIVILGGAFDTEKWTRPRNPGTELNIFMDPRAAAFVFEAGLPSVTLLPLDITNDICLTPSLAAALEQAGTPGSRLAHACYVAWCRYWTTPEWTCEEFPLWDPVTVAVAIDPSLVRTTRRVPVKVHTAGPKYGRTVIAATGPPINIVTGIDEPLFMRRFFAALGAEYPGKEGDHE